MTNDQVEQSFINDTANHTMDIINDDGVNRRIVFSNNGSSVYQYVLHTWPGYLMISGDMGTYVFRRINDMFEFFDTGSANYKINPGYWSEKLEAINSHCGQDASIKTYNEDLFEEMIKDTTTDFIKESELSEDEISDLQASINEEILCYKDEEQRAMQAAYDYYNTELELNFYELPFGNCREYSYHFIWILYAIEDAIKQYKTSSIIK